jgi:hypothetical protein
MFKKSFHKDFSQKGGRGSKPDALQEVILEIVAKNPKITTVQLEEALKEKKCEDDIDIDSNEDLLAGDQRQIHYEDDDGNEKTSYLSGLKDRLYRARKTLGSRKPVSAK